MPGAWAQDGPDVYQIGQQADLVDGPVIQGWTVYELNPSSDVIPYQPQGTLWEAVATDEAIQGTVTPLIPDLNARAANGDNYQALFFVASPHGINPATLAQGEETSGKIYFDVTGADPDSVVYNAAGTDLIVWEQGEPEVIIEDIEVIVTPDEVIIDETEVIVEGGTTAP